MKRDDFLGRWALERRISDHHSGQDGQMTGEAVFTTQGADRLIYDETGTLTLAGGTAFTATRRYLWQFGESQIAVFFADGRPFHTFVPAGHAAGTDHPCGDDFYTVRYDFTCWPDWQAVWTVTGPRKDYVSTSRYARLS